MKTPFEVKISRSLVSGVPRKWASIKDQKSSKWTSIKGQKTGKWATLCRRPEVVEVMQCPMKGRVAPLNINTNQSSDLTIVMSCCRSSDSIKIVL